MTRLLRALRKLWRSLVHGEVRCSVCERLESMPPAMVDPTGIVLCSTCARTVR